MKVSRQEIELKYRLASKLDYDQLCQGLGLPEEEVEQVNHYFQSDDGKVPGENGVIRIRIEEGRPVLGVKLGGWLADGVSRCHEYEDSWRGGLEPWPPSWAAFWEAGYAGLEAVEQSCGHRPILVWAGTMINRRKVYRLSRGRKLEVDASHYPDGQTDYEVEMETMEPDQEGGRLKALLERFGVRYGPQAKTKYARFLEHAGGIP